MVSDSEVCDSQTARLSPESGFGFNTEDSMDLPPEEGSHLEPSENLTTFKDLFRDIDFAETKSKPTTEEEETLLGLPCQNLDEILATSIDGENFDLISDKSCNVTSNLRTGFDEVMTEFSEESVGFDCPFDFETTGDEDLGWF